MLYNREVVLAFDFTYLGRVKKEVVPLQKIRIVLYKLQQYLGFRLYLVIRKVIKGILQNRLKVDILEVSYSTYQNLYFLVQKKILLEVLKKYYLINIVQEFNQITIRDTNLLLDIDSFLEEFIGLVIATLVNIFLGYD